MYLDVTLAEPLRNRSRELLVIFDQQDSHNSSEASISVRLPTQRKRALPSRERRAPKRDASPVTFPLSPVIVLLISRARLCAMSRHRTGCAFHTRYRTRAFLSACVF